MGVIFLIDASELLQRSFVGRLSIYLMSDERLEK